jgi:hypothetical protein
MPIPDYEINSLETFQEITQAPREIAGLYFYQLFDCLIEQAWKISADFRKRPQLYRDLGNPSLAPLLAELNAEYGTKVNLLSASERIEIYVPIFGAYTSQHNNDNFRRLRNDLLSASVAFVEGAHQHSLPMLREAMRTAHHSLKAYLLDLHGASTRFSKDALSYLTEKVCYPILRSKHIAAIFGVTKLAEQVEYPYAIDPARDLLVEQIALQLPWRTDSSQYNVTLTRDRISNLQKVARKGAETIATVIELDDGDTHTDLELLIKKCYVWRMALASLNAGSKVSQPSVQQPVLTSTQQGPSTAAAHVTWKG